MELELSCVLAGVESGGAFIVRINANRYIDDMKKAIKSRCKPMVTCDAHELKLYLAKKDGAWLNTTSAKAVTSEELPASFTELDPLLKLNSDECFGAEGCKQLKEREVHILVALPARTAGDTEGILTKRKVEEDEHFVQQKRKFGLKQNFHAKMDSVKSHTLLQKLSLYVKFVKTVWSAAATDSLTPIERVDWEQTGRVTLTSSYETVLQVH